MSKVIALLLVHDYTSNFIGELYEPRIEIVNHSKRSLFEKKYLKTFQRFIQLDEAEE